MKYKLRANVELDEYDILCLIKKDNLADFVDIVKKELDQWNSIEITIPIRRMVCTVD